MSKHFEREITRLKKLLLSLSAVVEESLHKAVKAVNERRTDVADDVVAADEQIDRMEVELEEECLKALALYQPVAADLRLVVSVLKINNDLERIGDLAVNIAHRASSILKYPKPKATFEFEDMASRVQAMLRKCLEALVDLNSTLAAEVCAADDEVDNINRAFHNQIRQAMREHPEDLEVYTYYMSVSRNLERVADHATNIAEDVIYLVDGHIIRHGHNRLTREGV